MSLDNTSQPSVKDCADKMNAKYIHGRPESELVPSRYALKVGAIDVLVVSDGVLSLPGAMLGHNVDPAIRAAWLEDMKRIVFSAIFIIAVVVAIFGGNAISAQDKYTLQVPGGLAFAEFKGYESWPVIAISENGGKMAVIVGNTIMIDAFKEGVPGNGKPFPDGAMMAKIHWIPKKQETYPGQPMVPGTQHVRRGKLWRSSSVAAASLSSKAGAHLIASSRRSKRDTT